MLDAISDFWKPSKKSDDTDSIDVSDIKPGSTIGFGFIPQSELSGQRVTVKQINTYFFDDDRMTSYVLDVSSEDTVAMIVSDSEQEKYVAISRKIPIAERTTLYENDELLACMAGDDKKRLKVNADGKWAAWTASEYKKIIGNLKGKFAEADYRSFERLPHDVATKEFDYTLLVSNNNEYAIEIEQYSDNKIEVYATVYRRLADIGEISPPVDTSQGSLLDDVAPPATKVASTASELSALKPANDSPRLVSEVEEEKTTLPISAESSKVEPMIGEETNVQATEEASPKIEEYAAATSDNATMTTTAEFPKEATVVSMEPSFSMEEQSSSSLEALPTGIEPAKEEMPSLKVVSTDDLTATGALTSPFEEAPEEISTEEKVEALAEEVFKESKVFEPFKDNTQLAESYANSTDDSEVSEQESAEETASAEEFVQEFETEQQVDATHEQMDQDEMIIPQNMIENKEQDMATFSTNMNGSAEQKTDAQAFQARAIPTKPQEVENDSVECELPAASRIIEEAISNEMSMSDVIRRVIALPVARQESVSIPVLLTDADYSLLAVRYGIPAADRAAIKAKIIEEISDFSGATTKQ